MSDDIIVVNWYRKDVVLGSRSDFRRAWLLERQDRASARDPRISRRMTVEAFPIPRPGELN